MAPTGLPVAPVRIVPQVLGELSSAAWDSLNLARATHLWLQDDLRGVVALLETIDIRENGTFGRADRAAFLLAVAHLRLGDRAAFERVAVTGSPASWSPYRQWLSYARLLVVGTPDVESAEGLRTFWDLPGAAELTAAHLLEQGRPESAAALLADREPARELTTIHHYLQGLAAQRSGIAAADAWRELAADRPVTTQDGELAAAGRLALAVAEAGNGNDPSAVLAKVTGQGPEAVRAITARALLALASGDTLIALFELSRGADAAADGREARDVRRIAGQIATAEGDWSTALANLEAAAASWRRESAWLAVLADTVGVDILSDVWAAWSTGSARNGDIVLPGLAWSTALEQLAVEATDLRDDPGFVPPVFTNAAATADEARTLAYARDHAPTQRQWRQWDSLMQQKQQALAECSALERERADLLAERARRLDYLGAGREQSVHRTTELDLALRELDGLLARLDLALGDLDRTRGDALRLFAGRTAELAERLRTSLIYLQAVRHFHLEGPSGAASMQTRADWPDSVPTPAAVLGMEQELASEIIAFLELFDARVPALVDRSCREVWVPRLSADSPALRVAMAAQHRRGLQITAALDSAALALPIDRALAQVQDSLATVASTMGFLDQVETSLRSEIIAQVVAEGRARLAAEREGLDYLRGNALYWLAVNRTVDPDDEAARADARAAREQAAAALSEQLARYPDSRARAENRYRLADLELLQARDAFQTRMAGFLGAQPTADDLQNRDLAPFIDYEPAIALYRDILAEDPDYGHLPAVLFQLGMILGDAGDPASAEYLAALVTQYPDSPFNQEASLRLGDQRFERRDYAGCQPHFTAAAAGPDPALRAIALYKLGWAHFEEDEFAAAAAAFGDLLDHYAAGDPAALDATGPRAAADLSDEAHEYLVQALIRAGGATAFAEHFARVGRRDYEAGILLAMGHQLSGVSLYGEAIACDRLWLDEFGDGPQALAVSRRLVTSYQRWHKPDEARAVHLELAGRFLPGQPWPTATTDSTLLAQSQDFARDAYRQAAVYAHQQARKSDDPTAWRLALGHYDGFLTHWPADPEAARMHAQAGEAAHHLGQFQTALDHFAVAAAPAPVIQPTSAAANDSTDFVREAAWQIVAVSDDWYASSAKASGAEVGPDSLAHRLLTAAAAFQASYPQAPERPRLLWRTGQLAYAHGWDTEAAATLSSLGRDYPDDANALAAVRMSGDAWYRRADYPAAGAAYAEALELARTRASDPQSSAAVVAAATATATSLEPLIPACYYQHAEYVAATDSLQGPGQAAPLFADVATRWPAFEHADLAWYRAGLGREQSGDFAGATAAWQSLLDGYPNSVYARDSALNIAASDEKAGDPRAAAAALDRFSTRFAADPDAAPALLKAADLLAAAGDTPGAEAMKTAFLTRFPGETDAVMAIREERALAALDGLTAGQSVAGLAALQSYRDLAAAHPELAEPAILARADFLRAQEAHARYTDLKLTQPLPAAIAAKQKSLENLLALYAACTAHGVAEYTRASAFQIGAAITHFGDALLASERPADLQGDDLLAYEDVLVEQSWTFYDRGEAAWSDLLQQSVGAAADPGEWLARTRAELWPRVARRFTHMPEAEFPLVEAVPPTAVAAATLPAGSGGQN